MSTERLRRELEALKARGLGNCRGCGYPNYPNEAVEVVWRREVDPRPEDREPDHCEVCGREVPSTVIDWAAGTTYKRGYK